MPALAYNAVQAPPMGQPPLLPCGDGCYSRGKPVPRPTGPGLDGIGDVTYGQRMWWWCVGQWCEVVVRGRATRGNYPKLPVCRVGREEEGMWLAGPAVLSLAMPEDCGRMLPPSGAKGVEFWQRVDPTIFLGV